MDKLALFNAIVKEARPAAPEEVKATSLDQTFAEIGLDSLDAIMVCIYFSEVYSVEEELAKTLEPHTPRECFEMYEKHSQEVPQTIEDALKMIHF